MYSYKLYALILALYIVITLPALAQTAIGPQGTGQILGRIVAAKDKSPVDAVTVLVHRAAITPVASGRSITAADGTFTIPRLPAGTYGVCVIDKNLAFLNPCEWPDSKVWVDVADGQTSGPLDIPVQAASILQVRVNDVASATAVASKDRFPPHVLVFVRDAMGLVHPAVETHRDATGIDFRAYIPFDTAVELQVQSKQVVLETATHAAVPQNTGLALSVQHSSTAAIQPSITFNAIGRNP